MSVRLILFPRRIVFMRGYCPKCKEYRSDDGTDAWGIVWRDGLAICKRCGSVVNMWMNEEKGERK